jgi:hypothetical protein
MVQAPGGVKKWHKNKFKIQEEKILSINNSSSYSG